MKLITNPTDIDIIDYNVDTKLYTIKAGASEKLPNDVASYLCRVYPFLQDEGLCHEPVPHAEKKAAKELLKTVEGEVAEEEEEEKTDPANDLSMIHGLGAKSAEKLIAAGIKTKQDFAKLDAKKLTAIVGGLVASKFKST